MKIAGGPAGRIVPLLVVGILLGTAFGCAKRYEKATQPAEAVTSLLELRAHGEKDPAVYRLFVPSDEIASAIASDSAARTAARQPTPDWRAPQVVAETSQTAEVRVIWKLTSIDSSWPEATLFKVRKTEGTWVVTDALPMARASTPASSSP